MKKNSTEKKKIKKERKTKAGSLCWKTGKEETFTELDSDEKSFEEIEIPGTVSKLDAIYWKERPCKAREYF